MNEFIISRTYPSRVASTPVHSPIESVLEAAHHLESSYGLHPFSLISLAEPELIGKILNLIHEDLELHSEDRVVILAIRPQITKNFVNDYINEIAEKKRTSKDSLYAYRKHIETTINQKDKDGRTWSEKQALVALDLMQAASKQAGVQLRVLTDHSDHNVDELLHLEESALSSLLILALQEMPERKNESKTASKDYLTN